MPFDNSDDIHENYNAPSKSSLTYKVKLEPTIRSDDCCKDLFNELLISITVRKIEKNTQQLRVRLVLVHVTESATLME